MVVVTSLYLLLVRFGSSVSAQRGAVQYGGESCAFGTAFVSHSVIIGCSRCNTWRPSPNFWAASMACAGVARGTGVNRLVFVLWESFTGVVETVQNVLPTWSMPRGVYRGCSRRLLGGWS